MKKHLILFAKFLVQMFIAYYIVGILLQILTPRGTIGIALDNIKEQNNACIVKIEEGMPAHQVGLKLDDCVVSVNEESASGKDSFWVASRIKGKPDTKVNIEIKRDDEILKYEITRAKNKVDWLFFLKK